MVREAIIALSKKQDLSYNTAKAVMEQIMTGEASPIQMSAYLTALSLKGETIDEITASAEGMRNHCERVLHDMDVLEIVGTGGDCSNTFNISTTASLIAAAAGIPVAKHGNRSASSKCGAADVLEALGAKIDISPDKSTSMLKEIGFCFMFAPNYHLAMKHVAPVRRELGIRTVFNILGPLTNPAGAKLQLMGVYDRALVEPLAQVMLNLGVKRAMVVHGADGIDEISLSDKTYVCEIADSKLKSYIITPEDFGFKRCTKDQLKGGDAIENAKILQALLLGEKEGTKSDKRNSAILNAGAAMFISGHYSTIREAITAAEDTINSGKAARKLEEFVRYSNS
ncbi:MAG: anthranilate phosphoribosyltransferase [Oscillospiraceae bacterium]|nr:anthranilate phosphoribosyltransferase [Oscillospiraceae bacterium]